MLKGIGTIFFDLDGTLNSLTMDDFLTVYAREAYKHFADLELSFEEFVKILFEGTMRMIASDNGEPVVNAFFRYFSVEVGLPESECVERFVKFYETNFDEVAKIAKPQPYAKEVIEIAKKKGIKLVLATQPLFYELATKKRVEWLGIEPSDFIFFSHATNSNVCKPNPKYFEWLLELSNSEPENTLMVGNDPVQDLAASRVGIRTWYTGNEEPEIRPDYRGSLRELHDAIQAL